MKQSSKILFSQRNSTYELLKVAMTDIMIEKTLPASDEVRLTKGWKSWNHCSPDRHVADYASLLSIIIQSLLNSECHCSSLMSSLRNRFEALLQPSTIKFSPLPAPACLMNPTVGSCFLGTELSSLLQASLSAAQTSAETHRPLPEHRMQQLDLSKYR